MYQTRYKGEVKFAPDVCKFIFVFDILRLSDVTHLPRALFVFVRNRVSFYIEFFVFLNIRLNEDDDCNRSTFLCFEI